MIRSSGLLAVVLALLSSAIVQAQTSTVVSQQSTSLATYRLTFRSTWSAATHPQDFPGNPHFSGLVGATHNQDVSFWDVAAAASDGVESMAETGGKSILISEVNEAISAVQAEFVLSGGGISVSPGEALLEFDISDAFPFVTVVSMLAPSPDWFVGVSGLDLRAGDHWVQQLVVPLVVYDAGTDSGTTYTSANDDTDPAQAIAELTDSPFDVEQQVGTFTFDLLSVVGVEAEVPDRSARFSVYPNPSSGVFYVQFEGSARQERAVRVFDVLGRIVESMTVAGGESVEVDLGGKARGLYVVSVFDGKTTASVPVVVVRSE